MGKPILAGPLALILILVLGGVWVLLCHNVFRALLVVTCGNDPVCLCHAGGRVVFSVFASTLPAGWRHAAAVGGCLSGAGLTCQGIERMLCSASNQVAT
jgi:hypothetical protein